MNEGRDSQAESWIAFIEVSSVLDSCLIIVHKSIDFLTPWNTLIYYLFRSDKASKPNLYPQQIDTATKLQLATDSLWGTDAEELFHLLFTITPTHSSYLQYTHIPKSLKEEALVILPEADS